MRLTARERLVSSQSMTQETREEALNERAQRLLRVLVQSYIRDGQPVGSRTLSRESGLALSSATVRNVMADLEELGFVSSPHTSAGRVPTDKAYRFFVDSLLRAQLPTDDFEPGGDPPAARRAARDSSKSLVAAASQLLSNITHLAGVVTLPLAQAAMLTQIEFLPLSENRVLVVLVFDDREVQNRIIQLDRHYCGRRSCGAPPTSSTSTCRGRTLPQIRQELVRQLKETHENLNQVMLDAISMAQRLFEQGSARRTSST